MSRLYPENLKNTHCVTIIGVGKIVVIGAWDRDSPAVTKHYEVGDIERLRVFCTKDHIYFLDAPSTPICEFFDGGEDANRPPESRWFATLVVCASTEECAKIAVGEIGDTYDAAEVEAKGSIDLDWPKYPDLIYRFRFTFCFEQEPDWAGLPSGQVRLNYPATCHAQVIKSERDQFAASQTRIKQWKHSA